MTVKEFLTDNNYSQIIEEWLSEVDLSKVDNVIYNYNQERDALEIRFKLKAPEDSKSSIIIGFPSDEEMSKDDFLDIIRNSLYLRFEAFS